MAIPLFGFDKKGINQRVLFEQCLRKQGPSTGFLRAAYCGFHSPLDEMLLAEMNPAEILGVSAGFFIAARKRQRLNFAEARPNGLYNGMLECAKEHYESELDRIDNVSHELKVRPYKDNLYDRLSRNLDAGRSKKLISRVAEYFREVDFVHDPCMGLHPSMSSMKLYIKQLFSRINSKYHAYESQLAQREPVDDIRALHP